MLVIVSLDLPQVVEVSALSMGMVAWALLFVILMCSEKLSLGSRVSPSTLGFLTVGMRMSLMERCRSAPCCTQQDRG